MIARGFGVLLSVQGKGTGIEDSVKPGEKRRVILVRLPPWLDIDDNHPRDLLWPIAALHGAAMARAAGWEASIIDLHVEPLDLPRLVGRITLEAPAAVVIETTTPSLSQALGLARDLRARLPRTHLLAVGQHPSIMPEDLLGEESPFDSVIRGEYEGVLGLVLLEGSGHSTPATSQYDREARAVRSFGPPHEVHDLDEFPPLSPTGLRLSRYHMRSLHVPSFRRQRWGFLQTSRGCPYRCIFCSPTLRQSYGHTFRTQSPEQVVNDMVRLERDHGVTAIYLLDDLFTYDQQRVLEICRLLVQRGSRVRWVFQTRVDCINKELLSALVSAGCCGLKVGIESGSDRVLRLLRKGITREQILQTTREVRQAGLLLTACYILGSPTETLEEMKQTFRLATKIRADMIQVTFHTPYPGSESFRLHQSGIADPTRMAHYEGRVPNLSHVSQQLLDREQRRFYMRYYLSPTMLLNYLRRRAVYKVWDLDEWGLLRQTLRFWARPREEP